MTENSPVCLSDQGALQAQAPSVTTELVERLSAATVGSRELDAAICIALQYGGPNSEGATDVRTDPEWEGDLIYEIGDEDCCNPIPALTTSLDAALALAERVLGGKNALHLLADLLSYEAASSDFDLVTVADVPRQLCIAILNALPTNTAGEETPSTSETEERG